MRILHVAPSFYPAHYYGGPIQSVYQLCTQAASLGYSVRVLTTNANGPHSVLDVQTGRELEMAPGMRVTFCRRVALEAVSVDLLRRLRSHVLHADVVHLTAVYSFPAIPALLTARLLNKPVVWSPRGALQRWSGSTRVRLKDAWDRICRAVRPHSLVLHVTSEQEAAESRMRYPDVRTVIIPNGIEIPDSVEHRSGGETLRIVYLGRLHPKKGIENLLEACARLGNSTLRWTVTIAGTGETQYAKKLRNRAAELGISSQVLMPGQVLGAGKRELFENADIAVFPSYTENFGLVVGEALAHGVAVVASRGTPWHEVEDRGCGLWVDNDPETLAGAILRMSVLPLRTMGERGRDWIRREFSWNLRARQTCALYEDLAGRSRAAASTGSLQ